MMYNRCQPDFQTQKERQQLGLNRLLLIFAILLYVFSTKIANYSTTVDEAWWRWKNILMFDLTLIIYALRAEVIKIVNDYGYKIVISLLVNYFIDQYFKLKGWSWNDFLTIGFIVIELIFKNKKYMKTLKKLVAKHWALIGLLATVYVDNAFEILANSGLSDGAIKLIHLSGVIICGYLWNPKPVEKTS